MKLAEPITNASGITLMPAGIRLTPMFILRLKKWNIEAVEVVAEKTRHTTSAKVAQPQARSATTTATANTGMTAEQEQFARAIATEVSRWFVNVRDNPLMMMLRLAAIKRLVAHGPRGMINVMRHPEGYRTAPEEVG